MLKQFAFLSFAQVPNYDNIVDKFFYDIIKFGYPNVKDVELQNMFNRVALLKIGSTTEGGVGWTDGGFVLDSRVLSAAGSP